jgi:hypothetical protein
MQTGQVVTLYGDPINQKYPVGKGTLVSFIKETKLLELWFVERPDGGYAEMFIKKDCDEKIKI